MNIRLWNLIAAAQGFGSLGIYWPQILVEYLSPRKSEIVAWDREISDEVVKIAYELHGEKEHPPGDVDMVERLPTRTILSPLTAVLETAKIMRKMQHTKFTRIKSNLYLAFCRKYTGK